MAMATDRWIAGIGGIGGTGMGDGGSEIGTGGSCTIKAMSKRRPRDVDV